MSASDLEIVAQLEALKFSKRAGRPDCIEEAIMRLRRKAEAEARETDAGSVEIRDLCSRLKGICLQYRITEIPSLRRIEARLLAAVHNRKLKGEGK